MHRVETSAMRTGVCMWQLSTISVIEPGKDAKNANNCACGDRSFAVLAITPPLSLVDFQIARSHWRLQLASAS